MSAMGTEVNGTLSSPIMAVTRVHLSAQFPNIEQARQRGNED